MHREIRVDRVDNGDGTHSILVDHVQVGPPFKWDDMAIEHYVRQTCLRVQREISVGPYQIITDPSIPEGEIRFVYPSSTTFQPLFPNTTLLGSMGLTSQG